MFYSFPESIRLLGKEIYLKIYTKVLKLRPKWRHMYFVFQIMITSVTLDGHVNELLADSVEDDILSNLDDWIPFTSLQEEIGATALFATVSILIYDDSLFHTSILPWSLIWGIWAKFVAMVQHSRLSSITNSSYRRWVCTVTLLHAEQLFGYFRYFTGTGFVWNYFNSESD